EGASSAGAGSVRNSAASAAQGQKRFIGALRGEAATSGLAYYTIHTVPEVSRGPARPGPKRVLRMAGSDAFVAIDFGTADNGRDSACAVALVRAEGERIVRRAFSLIRPPRRQFLFTRLHGISWHHVADQPTFGEVWPALAALLDGADYFVAH